jgi:hypothetical protein
MVLREGGFSRPREEPRGRCICPETEEPQAETRVLRARPGPPILESVRSDPPARNSAAAAGSTQSATWARARTRTATEIGDLDVRC